MTDTPLRRHLPAPPDGQDGRPRVAAPAADPAALPPLRSSTVPVAGTTAAVRAVDLRKSYGKGDTAVTALAGVTLDFARGRFTAVMGPVRLGQVDADALPRRAGHRRQRGGARRRRVADRDERQAADRPAPRPGRLRLPAVQPAADPDRRGEHPAAAGHRRPHAGPGLVRRGRPRRRAGRPALPPARPSCPAVSSSAWPAPVRSSPARTSSSPTSRPATSTPAAAPRCSASCSAASASSARPSSWSPTTRRRVVRRPGRLPGRRPARRRDARPHRRVASSTG